jgi:hypothetical protein
MFVRVCMLLVAGSLGLGMPAIASGRDPAAENPEEAAEKANTPEDKIICRSAREASLGTHMRRGRDCRPASEWKEREIAAKRELQRLRDKAQSPGMALGR